MENIGLVCGLVALLGGTCWLIYATVKQCLNDND